MSVRKFLAIDKSLGQRTLCLLDTQKHYKLHFLSVSVSNNDCYTAVTTQEITGTNIYLKHRVLFFNERKWLIFDKVLWRNKTKWDMLLLEKKTTTLW